jgi:hypothetical protein
LFDIGDDLPPYEWTAWGRGLQEIVINYISNVLYSIPIQSQREATLKKAIQTTKCVMLPFSIMVRESNDDYRRKNPEDSLIVSTSGLSSLQRLVIDKIVAIKDSALLRDAKSVGVVLRYWRLWGGVADPRQWALEQLTKQSGIFQILRSTATVESNQKTYEYLTLNLNRLCELIPIDEINTAVGQIDRSKIGEDEAKILALYDKERQELLNDKQPSLV